MVYDRRESALRVPNAALRFRPPPALLGTSSPAGGEPSEAPREHRHGGSGSAGPAGSGSAGPAGSASAPHRWGGGRGGNRPPADTSTKTLWVMRGPAPIAVDVKIGLTDGTFTEIVSGEVNENDEVVLEVTTPGTLVAPSSPPGGNQPPRMRL
jgi:HlyD family secretion protein